MTVSNPFLLTAISSWKSGEKNHWRFCHMASHIVGNRDGTTGILADALAISEDTIEKRAMAWRMYHTICLWQKNKLVPPTPPALELRNQLSIKHFWTIAQIWAALEFDPQDLFAYLQTAAENRASAEKMRLLVLGEQTSSTPDEWQLQMPKMRDILIKTYTSYGIPEPLREKIRQFLTEIAPWLPKTNTK